MRLAAAGVVALLAALVLGWSPLIPVSIVLVGAGYGAQLAIDDAPLDMAAPALAAGMLVTAELAYWSLEERARVRGEAGSSLRHGGFVAALGIAALLAGYALLALADALRASGLAVDLVGAAAAAATLFAIALAARGRAQPRDEP